MGRDRGQPDVLLATCRDLPTGPPDDHPLRAALEEDGYRVAWAIWDDPDVDWTSADAVLLRSTWDYTRRRTEFLEWVRGVPHVRNPGDVVAWNSDKVYLSDLASAGVPVVPTVFVAPGETLDIEGLARSHGSDLVVKPTVSAGSRGAGRFQGPGQAREALAEHVSAIHAAGLRAMIQPYLPGVDAEGESSLVFIGGQFSHAVRRGAMLQPGLVHGLAGRSSTFVPEPPRAIVASREQQALAAKVLRALPAGGVPLYARVDVLPTADGPVLGELELIEPSLFFAFAPGAAKALARAVTAELTRPR